MSHWDAKKVGRDLSSLIKLIGDYEIPVDVTKLYNLEAQLRGAIEYSIDIQDIAITISKSISKTKPAGVSKMTIFFSHRCKCDHSVDCSVNDPIKDYYFYFQINGYGTRDKEYINCWRLDQNIESQESKYTHPYYHFQAGGDELRFLETGDLILLSAPRLPHPPMDIFLGLHFILSNYLSTKDYPSVGRLFDNYEYQEIIKRSQKRMWEDYFKSFHEDNAHIDYTFERVFPLFIR
jgi:hypothetical protein